MQPRTTRICSGRTTETCEEALEDQAEALTEIQVEEKQVAETKNKVQAVKNSHEVTNSGIKLTPR